MSQTLRTKGTTSNNQSIVLELDPGTHYLCTCGLSKNGAYCDGNHQGTGLQPLALELESPKIVEISGSARAPLS